MSESLPPESVNERLAKFLEGLAQFKFKKNRHAKALGKLGGKVKSDAKASSSRENGKLGGRPKKKPV